MDEVTEEAEAEQLAVAEVEVGEVVVPRGSADLAEVDDAGEMAGDVEDVRGVEVTMGQLPLVDGVVKLAVDRRLDAVPLADCEPGEHLASFVEVAEHEVTLARQLALEWPDRHWTSRDPPEAVDDHLVDGRKLAAGLSSDGFGLPPFRSVRQRLSRDLADDHDRPPDLGCKWVVGHDLGEGDAGGAEHGVDGDLGCHRRLRRLARPQVERLLAPDKPIHRSRDALLDARGHGSEAEQSGRQLAYRGRVEVWLSGAHCPSPAQNSSAVIPKSSSS